MSEVVPVITHLLIVIALLIVYLVLTLKGLDGNLVFGLLSGYLGGAAVQRVTSAVK
jgi:hypothetical protein